MLLIIHVRVFSISFFRGACAAAAAAAAASCDAKKSPNKKSSLQLQPMIQQSLAGSGKRKRRKEKSTKIRRFSIIFYTIFEALFLIRGTSAKPQPQENCYIIQLTLIQCPQQDNCTSLL